MASEGGAGAEGDLARAARKRTHEEQEEWERVTRLKICEDREQGRAQHRDHCLEELVAKNARLTSRNNILEFENTRAHIHHLDYLRIKDENERLEAALEITGLAHENKRLVTELAEAHNTLCYVRGDLVRANARLHAIRKGPENASQ
jgi:hypothetical protein